MKRKIHLSDGRVIIFAPYQERRTGLCFVAAIVTTSDFRMVSRDSYVKTRQVGFNEKISF